RANAGLDQRVQGRRDRARGISTCVDRYVRSGFVGSERFVAPLDLVQVRVGGVRRRRPSTARRQAGAENRGVGTGRFEENQTGARATRELDDRISAAALEERRVQDDAAPGI